MKKYIKLAVVALAAVTFTACTEDKVYDVNFDAVPQASDYEQMVTVDVDQNTNYATFNFAGTGVYPVWIIDGKSYSTAHSFSRYYRKAGDYSVEVKFGNSNGLSQGTISKTFHVDKTKMNGFAGYVYESDFNLWTKATKQDPTFFYAPGWAQIADPSWSFDGDAYTLTLPEATTERWQAQMHVKTDINLTAGTHYDGSIIITSSQDISGITVKIHPEGDDDDSHSFFPSQKINLTGGEPQAFFFSDLEAAVDMNNVVYTFDFGGNPAGVELVLENIVLKDHADDDGTVLPELPTTPEPNWVGVGDAANLWSTVVPVMEYYYAPGWNQLPDPTMTIGNNRYELSLPSATFETWQAQVKFHTNLSFTAGALYDFRITFESNVDVPNVTVKLTQDGDDNNFFFAEATPLTGGGKDTFWRASVTAPADMPATMLVLDFGGNPDGTEVVISDIIIQEHHD